MAEDSGKQDEGSSAGATMLAAGVGSAVWDICSYTGLVVGGPVGAGIGWCVGAGLFALGVAGALGSCKK